MEKIILKKLAVLKKTDPKRYREWLLELGSALQKKVEMDETLDKVEILVLEASKKIEPAEKKKAVRKPPVTELYGEDFERVKKEITVIKADAGRIKKLREIEANLKSGRYKVTKEGDKELLALIDDQIATVIAVEKLPTKAILEELKALRKEVKAIKLPPTKPPREPKPPKVPPVVLMKPEPPPPEVVVTTDIHSGRWHVRPTDEVIQFLLTAVYIPHVPYPPEYFMADPIRQSVEFGYDPFYIELRKELAAPPHLKTTSYEYWGWLGTLYDNIITTMEQEELMPELTLDEIEWAMHTTAKIVYEKYLIESLESPLSDIVWITYMTEIENEVELVYEKTFKKLLPVPILPGISTRELATVMWRHISEKPTVPKTVERVCSVLWSKFGRDILTDTLDDVALKEIAVVRNVLGRDATAEEVENIINIMSAILYWK